MTMSKRDGHERRDSRDPREDARACSRCGVHIGLLGDEYCEPCAREIGAKPPMEYCTGCGRTAPREDMESIDVSGPNEYYPKIEYLCRDCTGGDDGDR